jgi:AcrR family transcriptional regulator
VSREQGGADFVVAPRRPLSPAFVEEHQRRRALPAVAELAHELGIEEITVSDLCGAARMGRSHFYELFGSREGCLEYAFSKAFEAIFGATNAVELAADEAWLAGIDAGIGALFETIAKEPLLAELCLIHASGSTVSAGYNFEAGVDVLLRLVSGGREAARVRGASAAPDPGPLIEEYLAGSLASLARLRLMQEKATELPEHRGEMVLLVASVFFGPQEGRRAWRELAANRRAA